MTAASGPQAPPWPRPPTWDGVRGGPGEARPAVLRSKKTQGVAGRIAAGLLKVCKEVVKKKGAASRG